VNARDAIATNLFEYRRASCAKQVGIVKNPGIFHESRKSPVFHDSPLIAVEQIARCGIAPRMTAATHPDDVDLSPLRSIRARIARSAALAARKADDVTLVAISKTKPAEMIQPLIDEGQRVFGENRVQEAQAKWPALIEAHPDIRLHLVGQLQSNKADDAVRLFDAIHTLDRPSLLTALARAIDRTGRRVPLFVQVNIGEEAQKGGCPITDVPALLAQARVANLPVVGLMCVPPAGIEAAPFFALLGKIASDNGLNGLSMGMSDDFETAVMLGATHVRVGSALFGQRAG
jgi:pyridoxal phosphate enzyme (YggS family)